MGGTAGTAGQDGGASTAVCPECEGSVGFDRAPLSAQIARCGSCGVELEVVSTNPIRLEVAPEVQEDWGE